jgi:hypothetical protein
MEEHYTNLFFGVILHVLLLFIFLTIFFWTVIRQAESKSLYSELDGNIKTALKDVNLVSYLEQNVGMSSAEITQIKNYYDGYFSFKDQTFENNNSQLLLFNIVIIVLIAFSLFASIFVRYLICGKSINLVEIISENLLILILVGAIEYFFFMQIASKFVPVKPSYLTDVVKKHLDGLLTM